MCVFPLKGAECIHFDNGIHLYYIMVKHIFREFLFLFFFIYSLACLFTTFLRTMCQLFLCLICVQHSTTLYFGFNFLWEYIVICSNMKIEYDKNHILEKRQTNETKRNETKKKTERKQTCQKPNKKSIFVAGWNLFHKKMALDCRALARRIEVATTLNLSSSLLIECSHAPPLPLNCVMNWIAHKKYRSRPLSFFFSSSLSMSLQCMPPWRRDSYND